MNKNIVYSALMVILGFGTDVVTFFSVWQIGNTVKGWYFTAWGIGGIVAVIGVIWLIISILKTKNNRLQEE
jgi:hypothetical protein